jgi:hypothetical protein
MSAMKLLLATALLGFAMAIGGLLYGVLAVGVPYHDPTPAQAAAERASLSISGWAMGGGGVIALVSLAGTAIIGTSRLVKPRS